MTFPNRKLPNQLSSDLANFLNNNDFIELYKSYSWRNDTFKNGFPDILRLETQLTKSDRNDGISLEDVKDVAHWGQLRNAGRIAGKNIVLPPHTLNFYAKIPSESLRLHPTGPVATLEENIERGIGPTYLSKVLRFGQPSEYGAIDTRCVRVFGTGDPANTAVSWLTLRVRNDGYGWYIPKTQAAWPSGYGTWIDILRFFANSLPNNCPHPKEFIELELRIENRWTCADVEMALFSYASKFT
jgi:hypothetical protein